MKIILGTEKCKRVGSRKNVWANQMDRLRKPRAFGGDETLFLRGKKCLYTSAPHGLDLRSYIYNRQRIFTRFTVGRSSWTSAECSGFSNWAFLINYVEICRSCFFAVCTDDLRIIRADDLFAWVNGLVHVPPPFRFPQGLMSTGGRKVTLAVSVTLWFVAFFGYNMRCLFATFSKKSCWKTRGFPRIFATLWGRNLHHKQPWNRA